jgi:hypothetical protein
LGSVPGRCSLTAISPSMTTSDVRTRRRYYRNRHSCGCPSVVLLARQTTAARSRREW